MLSITSMGGITSRGKAWVIYGIVELVLASETFSVVGVEESLTGEAILVPKNKGELGKFNMNTNPIDSRVHTESSTYSQLE